MRVDFHGGVLSQYYPRAETNGVPTNGDVSYMKEAGISATTTTGLTWRGVRLGASGKLATTPDKELAGAPWFFGQLVETDDQVWTTPREVSAPLLQVNFSMDGNGKSHDCTQCEHFLFIAASVIWIAVKSRF